MVVLYNSRRNKQQHLLSKKPLSCIDFSKDGKHLVTGEVGVLYFFFFLHQFHHSLSSPFIFFRLFPPLFLLLPLLPLLPLFYLFSLPPSILLFLHLFSLFVHLLNFLFFLFLILFFFFILIFFSPFHPERLPADGAGVGRGRVEGVGQLPRPQVWYLMRRFLAQPSLRRLHRLPARHEHQRVELAQ